jgi:hypothetical protein
MSNREPLFKKRVKQINLSFHIAPTSYRHKLFFEIFAIFIIVICGVIAVYRVINTPSYNISQVISSIVGTLLLLSCVIIVLLQTIKMHKDD